MAVNFLTYCPDEVNIQILSNLDPQAVCRFCLVSKDAKRIASDDRLWKALFPRTATPATGVKAFIESRSVRSIEEIQQYIRVFIENIALNKKGSFMCEFPFNPMYHISIGCKSGEINPNPVEASKEIVSNPDFQLVCYFVKPEIDLEPPLGLDIQGGADKSYIVITKVLLPNPQETNMHIANSLGHNVGAHMASLKEQSFFYRISSITVLGLAALGVIFFLKGK